MSNNKTNNQITTLVQDAVRRFKKLSARTLPLKRFTGAGVYALYYNGSNRLYSYYKMINENSAKDPIYIGKACPKKWRQPSTPEMGEIQTTELYSRIVEQCNTICQVRGLNIKNFTCRYMVLSDAELALADSIEAALLHSYQPLWNTCLDGFASHNPGSGRQNQAPSDWDVIHPGREWVESLRGTPNEKEVVERRVRDYIKETKLS